MTNTTTANNFKQRKKKITADLETLIFGKVPPQAPELEKTIIGTILNEKEAILTVQEILKPKFFYIEAHRLIYEAMQEMLTENEPIDLETVVWRLRTRGDLEQVGGVYYLTQTTNAVVSSANIETHCRIVLQCWMKRTLLQHASELLSLCYEDTEDVFDLLDMAESYIQAINDEVEETQAMYLPQVGANVIEKYERQLYYAERGEDDPNEMPTYMADWDDYGTSEPGMYVIAARPAMGKTAYMCQAVVNHAQQKRPIGVINAEMTDEQFIERLGCNLHSIDNYLLTKAARYRTREEVDRIAAAVNAVLELPIQISNTNSISKVVAKIKTWHKRFGIRKVYIDYLQLLQPSEEEIRRYQLKTDTDRVNYCVEILRKLAKQLKICIVVLSQLNRENVKRTNKEPNLIDLSGSDKISMHAYQIAFLHRPEYYEQAEDATGESTKNLCILIIAKNRGAKIGRVKFHVALQHYQFRRWEEHEWTAVQHMAVLPPSSNTLGNGLPIDEIPF